VYFAIIGIFVPSKRGFIKDAIKCFWKKLTRQHCTDAFDDLVHKQFVMWLADKNTRVAKLFSDKRVFDLAVSLSLIAFSLINVILLYVLYQWLFIKSPCDTAGEGVCPL
jgi:hypothetical protein